MPYSAFMSYAREDASFVTDIRRRLTRAGLSVFQDIDAIEGGAKWRRAIDEALSDCDALVVFVSENSVRSPAVAEEMRIAASHRCVIIPFLLAPADIARKTPLAELIEGHQWIDGADDFEDGALTLRKTLKRRSQPTTPVIAVSNLKGGVGKTTLASHIFSSIYNDADQSVCLIDLDPQSNLSQFVLTEDELEEVRGSEKSVISFFERGLVCGAPAASQSLFEVNGESIDPKHFLAIPHYVEDGKTKKLALVAGQFEIIKYTLSANADALEVAKQNFGKSIFEARRNFDLVVIDLNPSSSFLIECALKNSTHILCPVRPGKFSLQGIGALRSLIKRAYGIDLDRKIMIAMNGVDWEEMSDEERSLRADPFYGPLVLDARIPQTPMLTNQQDQEVLNFLSLSKFFGKGRYGTQLKKRFRSAGGEILDRLRIVR